MAVFLIFVDYEMISLYDTYIEAADLMRERLPAEINLSVIAQGVTQVVAG